MVERGVRRLVVAGGESSGAVVQCGHKGSQISARPFSPATAEPYPAAVRVTVNGADARTLSHMSAIFPAASDMSTKAHVNWSTDTDNVPSVIFARDGYGAVEGGGVNHASRPVSV